MRSAHASGRAYLLLASLSLVSLTGGVHFPLHRTVSRNDRTRVPRRSEINAYKPGAAHLRSRASFMGEDALTNTDNFEYTLDINIGGQVFMVQVDASTSDLWVSTEASSQYTDTGFTADFFYVTEAEGSIKTGELTVADNGLDNQAFLLVPPSQQFTAGEGILGVGPYFGSQVFSAISNTTALPWLDRLFSAMAVSETYITFHYGRVDHPSFTSSSSSPSGGGDFTIGELLPQWTNITSAPQLPVSLLNETFNASQHWQILLDKNGIIAPNGTTVITPTNASANLDLNATNQLALAIGSSKALTQVPAYVADAIYANVPGAQKENLLSTDGEVYVLPCDAEVNITMMFGGQRIPIHPLDANLGGYYDNDENPICVGGFQPALPFPGFQTPFVDGWLGLSFLRNVYMLLNFGSFVHGAPGSCPPPFIQFLPITDPATAHQEFVSVRVNNGGERAWGGLSSRTILSLISSALFSTVFLNVS